MEGRDGVIGHPLYGIIIPLCSKPVIFLDSTLIICYAPSPCLMHMSLFLNETEGDEMGWDWRQKQFQLALLPHTHACIMYSIIYLIFRLVFQPLGRGCHSNY